MAIRNFIAATAGHVDHGKSSLVKALTGTDPDRLPEEKARGITIDLGFAHLEAALPDDPASAVHIGVVDVPGHEDFVKNMVAGVGSIDIALLVVAADDGWMPQTEEHLQILLYLGVHRAVVALAKMDLAEDEAAAIAGVRTLLQDTPFANAPIVPTSVPTGRGMETLKAELARALVNAPTSPDLGKPRLPIDRAFTLRGVGTIVTGTLMGGALRSGQSVVLQPSGKTARIRSVQTHGREVERCQPGTRTALNLHDLEVGHGKRGEVVTLAELGTATRALDVLLEKSSRSPNAKSLPSRPLKDRTRVRIHHGSGTFAASVQLASNAQPLLPGQRVFARLRFETPIFGFAGDRFIVRDWAGQSTLAGGVVLDPDARLRSFASQMRSPLLHLRADSPGQASVFLSSLLARDHVAERKGLLLQSSFGPEQIAAAVRMLVESLQAVVVGDYVADAAWWKTLRAKAQAAIDAEHGLRPELAGLSLAQLRSALARDLPSPEVFDPLVEDLCQNGFTQAGKAIKRAGHLQALPPHLEAVGGRLRAALSAKPFEPPSRAELAPDAFSQQALRFLRDTGEAVEISEEIILLRESFLQMKELIVNWLRENGPSTASELRQAVGSTRRIMLPVLERLDREGVTKRDGDRRALAKV
ncbi:MAG: selenocysteine-specific translation elongation factor [Verrucomicrobia bacterium]|nr:selenocysteine-specific translation elongation factor [Verrucomicrobiota bacterium]